jgi:SAM-dependent methyltransferase
MLDGVGSATESNEAYPWEEWSWDKTLFAGAAAYYERGREPYAPGLAQALQEAIGLDGRGRLLDVGCGPGTVALRLATLFEEVVGVDPDPGMLAEAGRLAAGRGVDNAEWVCQRAEDLPGGLGLFRLITFAQSFHWMDRPRVARAVGQMLEAGGAVVQVEGSRSPAGGDGSSTSLPPPPYEAIDELRRRWLGPHRRAGQGRRNTSPSGEDDIFQAAGFEPAVEVVVADGRVLERTVDDIVANRLSMSGLAPHLFADQLDDFVAQLRALLLEVSPAGKFSVALSDNRLRIWRRR